MVEAMDLRHVIDILIIHPYEDMHNDDGADNEMALG